MLRLHPSVRPFILGFRDGALQASGQAPQSQSGHQHHVVRIPNRAEAAPACKHLTGARQMSGADFKKEEEVVQQLKEDYSRRIGV